MTDKYLLVVDLLNSSILRAVAKVRNSYPKFKDLGVISLTRQPENSKKTITKYRPDFAVKVIPCDFSSDQEISNKLEPYLNLLAAVTCRSDKHIQDLRKLVPLLPKNVLVSSQEALKVATNKRLMREAFSSQAPDITPRFLRVNTPGKAAIQEIESELSYPLVIKPTGLASSLLIHQCQTSADLETYLNKVFSLIKEIYKKESRLDPPEVIVEEFLDGNFYSIDAYVLKAGEVYFCPPVAYLSAKHIGVDDFYLYKRTLPADLNEIDLKEANKVARRALSAVGLTYSSAHIELAKTKSGWKVIEIGPRLGRFRDQMYRLAYGFDHSLNDVLIHLGLKPFIYDKPVNHLAVYSIYPNREGMLAGILGLDKVINDPRCKWLKISARPGQNVKFAKNGGHALAEFILSSEDPQDLLNLVNYVEKEVKTEITTKW